MRSLLNPRQNPNSYTALKKRAYHRGLWGERLAALYLRAKGYHVLETRFKTPFGEIDLLVKKGKTLVAVEVKQRKSLEKAMLSLTPLQQRRIERALAYYCGRLPSPRFIRFDVVLLAPWTWPFHLQGAWRAAQSL